MAFVDPWGGYKEGVQNIADAAQMSEALRQAKLKEAWDAEQHAQTRTDWGIKNQLAQQTLADAAIARKAQIDAAKPQQVTSEVPNPAADQYKQGLASLVTAQNPPAPLQTEMQNFGLASSPEENAQGLMGAAPPETLKQTQMVQPSAYKMELDAAKSMMAAGHPQASEKLKSAMSSLLDGATKLFANNQGEEATKLMSEATGAPMQYMGSKGDFELMKSDHGILAVNKKKMNATGSVENATQIIPGTEKMFKPESWEPLPPQQINGSTVLQQRNTATGKIDSHNVSKDYKPTDGIGGALMNRPIPVLDTQNGNAVGFATRTQIMDEPGRYLPSTGGATEKIMNKENLMRDIMDASKSTRQSLENLKTDFSAAQRAQFSYVLKSRDSKSALSTFMGSSVAKTLTPDQVDYITDIVQLKENAMAMRSVLGAGQGSDEMREAITATIPGAATADKAYAQKQLDKFDNQLARLNRGVPKIPLKGDNTGPKAGDVVKGYKFLGGNPADKNNWKKAGGA